ncbi:phage tail assembly protein [Pseudomonas sp. GD04158]|uniref:phage tail assembly protein n=1 Tax=Pseudomonas sp. GD04158 TaxID=2975439 RepID=UPI002447A78A|nr:phage tail assembly protein [Pseudomonas sp. GD04158]MDH0097460.1 phage tail assembly protein [Pseudomonas sp. GD04158]
MEKTEFKLSQPISAHGETVTVLQVRRPTMTEVRNIKGFPYVLGENMLPVADTEKAAKYIAVCCAIPPSSVDQLGLFDFNKLSWEVIGFFVNPAASSTTSPPVSASPSTSPTTGE